MTPKAQVTKGKIDNGTPSNLKSFVTVKETIKWKGSGRKHLQTIHMIKS
jgi:hypothetical protein